MYVRLYVQTMLKVYKCDARFLCMIMYAYIVLMLSGACHDDSFPMHYLCIFFALSMQGFLHTVGTYNE